MKVKSGDYDVLESGTIMQFKNEPIEFELASNMNIRFMFITDGKPNDTKMVFKNISDSLLELHLYNFHNSMGTGNTEPLPLGNINNRKLYLNFRVFSINDVQSNRVVHYTWYLGEEVDNG